MDKTTVLLNKLDLEGIVGNKSKFIREAIREKLFAQSSSKSNINVRISEVKAEKTTLEAQLGEVKIKLKQLKVLKRELKC